MLQRDRDLYWMQQALGLAGRAQECGEVPVAAILLRNEQCLSSASNQTLTQCDPTAHAEVLVLREAAKIVHNHRLVDATVYVTLEPCLMCVGAMIQARIKRLVFAAYDHHLEAGVWSLLQTKGINHRFLLTGGLLAEQSAEILREFFLQRRRKG